MTHDPNPRSRAGLSPTLVILDCDGVLFDSYAANVAYYDSILARLGRPPLDEPGRDLAHRLSTPQLFAALFGNDSPLAARAQAVAHETDYGPFYSLMSPTPELWATLRWLRERFSVALATNRGKTIPGLLREWRLAPYFEFVVGMNDVPRPKPAPDMLLRCLTHFALPGERALYVGDSPTDASAAAAAGIPFLAVGDAIPDAPRVRALADIPSRLGRTA